MEIINIVLLVSILICLALILRLTLKLYSRQRFGWFIATAAITLVSPYLFRSGFQLKIITWVKTRISKTKVEISIGQFSLEDKVISFLLIALVIWFMYALFINWDRRQHRDDDK